MQATGYDALTGALTAMNAKGTKETLQEYWKSGVKTYFGLMAYGFPNFFFLTGPQASTQR